MVIGVVSMLAFYPDDPSLRSTVFSYKMLVEKNENKKNEAGVVPLKKVRMELKTTVGGHLKKHH